MTVLHAILVITVSIGSSSDTVFIVFAKMGRCHLNEAKLRNKIYIYKRLSVVNSFFFLFFFYCAEI